MTWACRGRACSASHRRSSEGSCDTAKSSWYATILPSQHQCLRLTAARSPAGALHAARRQSVCLSEVAKCFRTEANRRGHARHGNVCQLLVCHWASRRSQHVFRFRATLHCRRNEHQSLHTLIRRRAAKYGTAYGHVRRRSWPRIHCYNSRSTRDMPSDPYGRHAALNPPV